MFYTGNSLCVVKLQHRIQRPGRGGAKKHEIYVAALGGHLFTTRKQSLGQGNIFAPVCHSVHGGDGIPACIAGGIPAYLAAGLLEEEGWYPSMPCRWYPSMPCSRSPGWVSRPTPRGKLRGLAGRGSPGSHLGSLQAHTWGVSRHTPWGVSRPTPRGCVSQHALRQTSPLLWRATAMDSTHPTGMHSCL